MPEQRERACRLFVLATLVVVGSACGSREGVYNARQDACSLADAPPLEAGGPGERTPAETGGYVGMTMAKARALAAERGHVLRIFGEDEDCVSDITDDLRFNRVNVYIVDERVEVAKAF